jgi:hypothetical protein
MTSQLDPVTRGHRNVIFWIFLVLTKPSQCTVQNFQEIQKRSLPFLSKSVSLRLEDPHPDFKDVHKTRKGREKGKKNIDPHCHWDPELAFDINANPDPS